MREDTAASRHAGPALRPGDWAILAAALPAIAILSQGVHDLAINCLGIPYPYDTAVPVWVRSHAMRRRFCFAVAPGGGSIAAVCSSQRL
ncbi:hypothetical protein [Sphingomonas oryzagri]|uniref:Uncharacterized protein n=1 Tax=Sphingomonas oryzagri TaxID=3042314 RepID=A0ABT6MXM2_9SPHN|nr:hypothetical protein [Sphingomonas oryzagri]MDH7637662.1 hypothetical protein [Sphingomonas oryzagri]